jgi:hypothetical protein
MGAASYMVYLRALFHYHNDPSCICTLGREDQTIVLHSLADLGVATSHTVRAKNHYIVAPLWMEVSGQLLSPASLPRGGSPILIKPEARWIQSRSGCRNEEKNPLPHRLPNPGRPARSSSRSKTYTVLDCTEIAGLNSV